MVQPSPASFRSAIHAASEFSVVVFGRVGSGGRGDSVTTGILMLCSASHSRAALMAFDRTSSGDVCLLLKMRLLRASQSFQRIQSASCPSTIPDGGGDNPNHRACQQDAKSIIPLISILCEKGARFQALVAKLQWRKRWLVDSAALHRGHTVPAAMFRAARLLPTRRAPRKVFKRNSFNKVSANH